MTRCQYCPDCEAFYAIGSHFHVDEPDPMMEEILERDRAERDDLVWWKWDEA